MVAYTSGIVSLPVSTVHNSSTSYLRVSTACVPHSASLGISFNCWYNRDRKLYESSNLQASMLTRTVLLLFLWLGVSTCNGYRFLAIFPFEMKSHRGVLEPIVEELAKRGHQIDLISRFAVKTNLPNYKTIIELPTAKTPSTITFEELTNLSNEFNWLYSINTKICDLLGHPEISKLIKNPPKDPPYDAIIVHVLSGYQCMSAIGIAWDLPVIGIVTTMLYPQMLHYQNNPLNLASMPRHYRSYEVDLNFWGRVHNVIMTNYYLYRHFKDTHVQDHYIRKYLGADMPSYKVVEKNYALILSNSHYLYHGVKAQAPGLIEIGGINVKNDSSVIEPSLKKFLDDSKDGFVYFSFGSITVIESLPREIMDRFYAAIRKISPVRVLLKSTNPERLPKNLPDNVFTFPWLPQQKILQHPNIRAFVTHGGGLGTQEAVYYKVPMICVPLFAEQRVNCDILKHKNVSITLLIKNAPKEDYVNAFTQVLMNPSYKTSMDKFSALYWDRPQSPREAVVYWVEYVMRHGKDVLRTQGLDLTWWQLELFDVYAFLLACLAITLLTITLIVRQLLKFLSKTLCSAKRKPSKKVK